jgi:uncharacterized membrane protein YkgB
MNKYMSKVAVILIAACFVIIAWFVPAMVEANNIEALIAVSPFFCLFVVGLATGHIRELWESGKLD